MRCACVTPFQHFKQFYSQAKCQKNWKWVLNDYLVHHYVYCSPTAICLAKADGDTWFIEFYAGDLQEVFSVIPFWLDYVGFYRKGRYRCYALATVVNKIMRNESGKPEQMVAVESGH